MTTEIQIPQIKATKFTDIIELTMVDGLRRKKNVMLMFNAADDWRSCENFNADDVPGWFAGTVMEMFKKDSSAFAYAATAFKVTGNQLKKFRVFTPMMKIDDEFKECHIKEDGSVVMV